MYYLTIAAGSEKKNRMYDLHGRATHVQFRTCLKKVAIYGARKNALGLD